MVLSSEQKIAAGFMAAFIILMYLPSLIPTSWAISSALTRMGILGMASLLLVLLGVWRKDGKQLVDVDILAAKGVPWKIVFLMVGNCVIASGIKSPDAGIIKWLGTMFGPIVGDLSPILFYAVLIILYGVTTQFVHNAVLLTIFNPIALTFSELIGANPVITTFIGIVILSAALATAGASSRSGLVFGNTEWIEPKYAYTLGVGSVVMVMIAFFAIGVPIGLILFPV